jgi:hypothetical protein
MYHDPVDRVNRNEIWERRRKAAFGICPLPLREREIFELVRKSG